MNIEQRDVFLLPFPFGDKDLPHPFIVISDIDSNRLENTFIGVMITSSEICKDDFSFELTNDMFESPLDKENCHVRMHLLTIYANKEILSNKLNKMKDFYFKQLMKAIGDLVFNYKFTSY